MTVHMSRPHLDADSIAEAVEDFVTEKVGALITPAVVVHQAHATADADSAAVNTGIATPANASYTQADQTALANDVIALITKHNALVVDFNALVTAHNALLDALQTATIMAAS